MAQRTGVLGRLLVDARLEFAPQLYHRFVVGANGLVMPQKFTGVQVKNFRYFRVIDPENSGLGLIRGHLGQFGLSVSASGALPLSVLAIVL